MRPGRGGQKAIGSALALLAASCAHYVARPLPAGPDLAHSAASLRVDVSHLRLGPLRSHPFDPAKGLDPTDVAILAVLNSPDLVAKRAAAKVAAAEAFSAGLLPDPQLVASADVPDHPSMAATALALTPSIDILALVTRPAALAAARASQKQADLDVLWAEWSTAQQARQLTVTVVEDEAKSVLLRSIDDGLAERYRQSNIAYVRHDVTAPLASADLAAKLDADSQLAAAEHDALKARGDLNALVGLSPEVRLDLVAGAAPVEPEPAALDAALAALPDRRPDLLALKAGYGSQDANLRKAIISQFPLISLGYSRQRDNTNILSNGATATVVIPIFNRGRGDIAVQTATRERLAQEYQARLDKTVADVAQARVDLTADKANLARLQAELPPLLAALRQARPSLARRDLDSGAFLAIEQAALKEQVALVDLRLATDLAGIGLETELFLPPDQGNPP